MVAQCSDEALVEFAYVSRLEAVLPPAALVRLERQCWAHNVRAGLTGELRHEDGVFVQVVEGRWSEVMSLASRILTDSRHTSINIRSFRQVEKRRFASWTASGLSVDDAAEALTGPALANVHRLPAARAADPHPVAGAMAEPIQLQR